MGIFLSMTLDDETEHPVGDVLRRHYELKISPEVAARHTMAIHREAARLRIERRRSLRTVGRPRRAVVASLVGAMLVGSSTGAIAASEETLPGDLLYGVKRTSEQARLFAAATFAREGLVHLDIARMRVHEAQIAAPIKPVEVVEQLKAEAEAALAAAEAEGANVESEARELIAQAEQAVERSTAVALAPTPSPDALASPSPVASAGASPSPSASADPSPSPSDGASPAPSPSDPVVVPSGEPETGTVLVPDPSPSPTATP